MATSDRAHSCDAGVTLTPISEPLDGFLSFRLQYLLPLAVEVQYFPPPGA